jgi:hypothetical protein
MLLAAKQGREVESSFRCVVSKKYLIKLAIDRVMGYVYPINK